MTNVRSKTFSGCWTCRSRHLKCGKERPVCRQCTKSSRQCEGYELRLAWEDGARSHSAVRSFIDPDATLTVYSDEDINRFLGDCEAVVAGETSQTFGPFSVISNLDRTSTPCANNVMAIDAMVGDIRTTTSHLELILDDWSTSPASNAMQDHANMRGGSLPSLESPAITQRATHNTAQEQSPVYTDRFTPIQNVHQFPEPPQPTPIQDRETAADCNSTTSPRVELDILSPWHGVLQSGRTHLATLPDPTQQTKLVQHWLFFMCDNMVPTTLGANPYRSIYAPMALEGLGTLTTGPKGKAAVFHGICATAAESLSQLGRGHANTNLLAAWHGDMAIQLLQESIRDRDREDIASVLAAILICIMRDTVTGRPGSWRGHCSGALKCLAEIKPQGIRPGSRLHVILEQFLSLAILADIDPSFNFKPLVAALPDGNSYLAAQHSMTKRLLESILEINNLQRPGAPIDQQHLACLGLQFYLQTPSSVEHDYCTGWASQISQHYAHVFHYAMLLHFERNVHSKPPEDIQDLVRLALEHLEAAEDIGDGRNGCIILWPCLISAAECCTHDMQSRWLVFFKKKSRHGFRGVDMAATICQEYWEWRSRNNEKARELSCLEFIRNTDLDVVPL